MLNQKTALYGVLTFTLASPTYASLDCTAHPSCSSLGYAKTQSCPNGTLISCPFDTTYKKCVQEIYDDTKCASFDLTSCPSGESCYKCETAEGTRYVSNGCAEGYSDINGVCKKAYDSCEDAGYYTSDEGMDCSSETISITLTDGTTTSCYSGCEVKTCPNGEYYRSCSDVGGDYYTSGQAQNLESLNEGWTCTAETINLTSGSSTTCYKCQSACDPYGYFTYSEVDHDTEICETEDIYLSSGDTVTCYHDCVSASTYEYSATSCSPYDSYANSDEYCKKVYKPVYGDKRTCYSCETPKTSCSVAGYSDTKISGKTCSEQSVLISVCGERKTCYYCYTPSSGSGSSSGSSGLSCADKCEAAYDASGCSSGNLAACYDASARRDACLAAC